jgi:hypothetical protein
MKSENHFQYQFAFLNREYAAEIFPTCELSHLERKFYKVTHESFFVRLNSPYGMKHFELFVDEDLEWHTNTEDEKIGDELIQLLGNYVDQMTM